MKARSVILFQLLLTLLLSGCATHEMVLSRTLRPVLSSEEVSFPVTLFRARVQMDRLEVWVRVKRSDSDYKTNFDNEIESTAALCAALANFDRTFSVQWSKLELAVTNEYGSQYRWKTAHSFTKVTITRKILLELRKRIAPSSAYPGYWHLFAAKVGPPDYVYYEWSPGDVLNKSGPDGR